MKRSIVLISTVCALVAGSAAGLAANRGGAGRSFYAAADSGDLEALKQHIENGANVNQVDAFGYSALKRTIEPGHTEAVKLLLDAGADANIKDRAGTPALLSAASRGHAEIVKLLLAKGADVNARDRGQRTAMHVATQARQQAVVELLVEAGADVNAEDSSRQTPLSLALRRNMTDVAAYLRQHGAKEPEVTDPRSMYGDDYTQTTTQAATADTFSAPEQLNVLDDPNAIRRTIKSFPGLEASLQVVDANAQSEQRSWAQRRMDNRTSLIRAVERQFGQEMAFLKTVAQSEKAAKTVAAIDTLSARRQRRYELVGDALREQRREEMRTQSAAGRGRSRGRYTGRSTRGGSSQGTTATTTDPYGREATTPTRPRRRDEPNEPPIDELTQRQIQDWVQAEPEEKERLLESVHQADLGEFGGLHRVASEEQAKKTTAAIEGVMLARQERVAKIQQEWVEDDERMQRMQERADQRGATRGRGRGMQGTQGQTTQQSGRRYR
ncbi:MAG: ankyrin repeat domain-containing protein [Sedimentisphaerales bacterium]|nr:ankyrin repeat domain-containing protein [Sedimentisphaerales bacterium]